MKLKVISNSRYNNQDLTIHMRGNYFRLNKKLYKALDCPEYVKFALDRNEKILGIAKCEKDDVNRFTVNARSFTLCSSGLYKEISKMILANPRKVSITFDGKEDGYFIAYLDKGVFDGE